MAKCNRCVFLYLNALFVECVLVKVQYGGFDGAWRGKNRQTDVDGVAAFGVQNDDLLPLPIRCCFLFNTQIQSSVQQMTVCHSFF